MSLIFNKETLSFTDTRCPQDKILCGGELSVCYTLPSDDITVGEKVSATPYTDRCDYFELKNDMLISQSTGTVLQVSEIEKGVVLELQCDSEVSEFGLNLPINFMGKLNGGEWKNQFLFNSVYTSPDKSIIYAYLAKPSGNNLVVAILSEADGWKMDYSPYLWGHYFVNLKLLARFDKVYHNSKNASALKVGIFPVSDFDNALEVLSRVYGVPFMDYSVGGGAIGEKISLKLFGECDSILKEYEGEKTVISCDGVYEIAQMGEVCLTPCCKGRQGAGVTVYGYESLEGLYKRAMDSVDTEIIKKYTDGNLCEHQCWASATLRFLMHNGCMLSEAERDKYEKRVLSLLNVITEQNVEKAEPRRTILNTPHDIFPAYNVFKSRRVQELFFGITILLDAFKYFGDAKYYEYATGATNCLISFYQRENGALYVDWGDSAEDYTTVCCAMIPLVDMACFTKDKDPALSSKYFSAAAKMADFLYKRGLHFPTEGGKSALAQEEMEDGSISCTALALLYYAKNAEYVAEYVSKAKEILDIHDSWVIKTPICQMHGSSLRWWETQWEGDADGPAICAGHAWSIWRAEADYLYYELSGDEGYLIKAKNGFMTNLSKIDKNGVSYSTYNPDMINGGGFVWNMSEVKFELASRFASIPDCGISRYPFIRINDTLLKER